MPNRLDRRVFTVPTLLPNGIARQSTGTECRVYVARRRLGANDNRDLWRVEFVAQHLANAVARGPCRLVVRSRQAADVDRGKEREIDENEVRQLTESRGDEPEELMVVLEDRGPNIRWEGPFDDAAEGSGRHRFRLLGPSHTRLVFWRATYCDPIHSEASPSRPCVPSEQLARSTEAPACLGQRRRD
jgi:hypothetical protein